MSKLNGKETLSPGFLGGSTETTEDTAEKYTAVADKRTLVAAAEHTAAGICAADDEDTAAAAAVGSIAVEANTAAAAEEDTAAVGSVVAAAAADTVAGRSVPCWGPGLIFLLLLNNLNNSFMSS